MVETHYLILNAPKLALLADLHSRPYRSVIDRLERNKPDLICIVGDIIYGSQPKDDQSPLKTQENVLPFFRNCSSIAPSFLSLGNHEWMLDRNDLEQIKLCGITVLDNDFKTIVVGDRSVIIGGLTSAYCLSYRRCVDQLTPSERASLRYPKKKCGEVENLVPSTEWLKEYSAAKGWHILMSHHPEYWNLISDYPIDLCLSAHAHGGQWRIFGHGIWSPGQGFWPSLTSGIYDGRLVISRGLSNTAKVPRFFNPTEIVFIDGK